MQTICTSVQTDNHSYTPSLNFYRPDPLPDAQPTVSKHWRKKPREIKTVIRNRNRKSHGDCHLPRHHLIAGKDWNGYRPGISFCCYRGDTAYYSSFYYPTGSGSWGGTAVRVRSPCPTVHTPVAVAINATAHVVIQFISVHRIWI